MKKINLLFGVLVFAFGLFVACSPDEDAVGPSISLVGSGGYIATDVTVAPGDDLPFKWTALKGDANLKTFTIFQDGNIVPLWNTIEIPNAQNASYTAEATIAAPDEVGEYTYSFEVTDKNDLVANVDVTVTVEETGDPIVSYSDKILGSYDNNTNGSSFASIDGTVYTMANAKANSNKIDFVYFYGSSNGATIAAPSDADAATVYDGVTTGLATWSVRNATKFKATTITATQFDAMTNDLEIIAAVSGATATKANQLQLGSVVAFETASTSANASKKGLFKVTNVATGAAGSITISVKVQE